MKRILQQALVLLMFFSIFLIWPERANSISVILLCMILAFAIFLMPAKHYSSYKSGAITKKQVFGNIGWDILKIFTIIVATTFLSKTVAVQASTLTESYWPGRGALGAFVALLVVSLIAVNGVALGMERLGKLVRLA